MKSRKVISGKTPGFGAIFMSNRDTMQECLEKGIFGLPGGFSDFVMQVRAGMVLFLFEHESRRLHGVFEATSNGGINIIPDAYRSSGKRFPAQVCIRRIWQCYPLPEIEFRDVIEENYFQGKKFNFGLSKNQIHKLLLLYESRKDKSVQTLSLKSEIEETETEASNTVSEVEEGELIRLESSERKSAIHKEDEQELEDFIPLSSSDDSDSEDRNYVSDDSGPLLPVPQLESLSRNGREYRKPCQLESNLGSKGLYADVPDERVSVFARVTIPSKDSEKEECMEDNMQVESGTKTDKTVYEIMEELQQRYNNQWTSREVKVSKQSEDSLSKKRKSVFSRLIMQAKKRSPPRWGD